MLTTTVSKPLVAGLLGTLVLTVIALLKPMEEAGPEVDMLPWRAEKVPGEPNAPLYPWVRETTQPEALVSDTVEVAPPPPRISPKPAPPPVRPAARPMAPSPAFVYLGRMVDGAGTSLFLQSGSNIEVVSEGDVLDGKWRIEATDGTGMKLRHLPSEEIRHVAVTR